MRLHHIGDFAQWVEDAGAGFAMNEKDIGDVGVGLEQGVYFLGQRGQVIALVEGDEVTTEVFQGLGGTLAISAVHQHQRLAVSGNGGGQRSLHRVTAAALQWHAGETVILDAGHAQQMLANFCGHLVERHVP
ncbi:hypothetical protein D3C73_1228220 [compost metagenome]